MSIEQEPQQQIQIEDLVVKLLENPYQGVAILYRNLKGIITQIELSLSDRIHSLEDQVKSLSDELVILRSENKKPKTKK